MAALQALADSSALKDDEGSPGEIISTMEVEKDPRGCPAR
jgi:hypothetical protein